MADDKETKCDKCLTDHDEPGKWTKSSHENYLELIKFNSLGQWSLNKKEKAPTKIKTKLTAPIEMGTQTPPKSQGKVGVLKE